VLAPATGAVASRAIALCLQVAPFAPEVARAT
jgi:hypothetical protein